MKLDITLFVVLATATCPAMNAGLPSLLSVEPVLV